MCPASKHSSSGLAPDRWNACAMSRRNPGEFSNTQSLKFKDHNQTRRPRVGDRGTNSAQPRTPVHPQNQWKVSEWLCSRETARCQRGPDNVRGVASARHQPLVRGGGSLQRQPAPRTQLRRRSCRSSSERWDSDYCR
jgi:hypothetical protein